MLSSNNLLKPATGEPVAVPTQDMVLGCYWMTRIEDGLKGEGKIFTNKEEALLAKTLGYVHLKARVKVRRDGEIIETSVGRMIFNESMPEKMDYINKTMKSKDLRKLISDVIDKFGIKEAAIILDKVKRMGFKYATTSGISWGMSDIEVPKQKKKWLDEVHKELDQIQTQYDGGLLTDAERKSRVIEIWNNITEKIAKATPDTLDPKGSVFNIFDSKARGSLEQLRQMSGMKGLVVNPSGEIIELPIRNSYKEGLNVLEYFISTHGGRKGMADTALKTATAGYLTRRLVDVCQDVVVREVDCGDRKGIHIYRKDEEDMGNSLALRIVGRISLEKIDGIVKKGQMIDKEIAQKIDETGVDKINVRSVISCQSTNGICQNCYGYDLGRNKLINMGEAIGIVTAQAIGEPGTQLTLRTFHTGGVAGGEDITQGLPRVEEIFEARPPKGKAIVSEIDGQVDDIIERNGNKIIQIELSDEANKAAKRSKNKKKIIEYSLPSNTILRVEKGDLVAKGQQLSEGHIDLKELYKVSDRETVHRYIIREVQKIYTFAGENINDKHIEMIIRQMFSRLKINNPGSTKLLSGEMVEWSRFQKENQKVTKKNGRIATAETLLLGVTKVSLTTESFLSAASFIETTRVLIDAAIAGKKDTLKGLKENVIIGKLIPAGTGYTK